MCLQRGVHTAELNFSGWLLAVVLPKAQNLQADVAVQSPKSIVCNQSCL